MEILMAKDRLTDLPELILLHILSMLPDSKQVVRTSALSKQWRFLWKSVPVSLDFHFPKYPYESKINKKKILAFAASTNRELHYWRSCEKIQAFRVFPYIYKDYLTEHLDFWVHFATNIAHVEEFTLQFDQKIYPEFAYLFPQFACTNTSLRKLVLGNCQLNPSGGSVNWTSLVSLSIGYLALTEGVMENILSGSPNLECLELDKVCGIRRLDISSLKLRKLIITNYETESDDEHVHWLEIFAPYIRHLELLGFCCDEIRLQLRNVASLVTAVLSLNVNFFEVGDEQDKLDKECRYLQELLHSVAHVKNLELGPWCTEFLSVLELKGRLFPQSSWQFLKLNTALEQLDFPGICSFLQSSLDLETLVIDWNDHKPKGLLSRYTNEDEQSRRFGAHNVNCSLLHLKTIKFINFYGQLSESKFVLPLVKYLLKNATVLKKFVLSGKFKWSDVPRDYVKMEQEFLSIPRSSPHASVVFSY
ncbi:F-box/LRR-repeat protein At3g03360-like isoform X1 [Lycium ferocissimum]|uniref:F-box/LRR-repeat protein At3g03360-like isoform X1 n=1 Tax=Lycium ferocissimum TaxID=112874 RepID=UPI0028158F45|nr:F-box/LRR-repeat protein At3g03360-like isoform X1 [Lycium ferocissimum]